MISLAIKAMNSGAEPYFSRKVSELQSGVVVNNAARTITGVLNYIENYNLFGDVSKDHGNFLALEFSAEDVEIKVALRDKDGSYMREPVVVDDGFCVFRVTSNDQKLVVSYSKDENSGEVVYDLSGLILKSK